MSEDQTALLTRPGAIERAYEDFQRGRIERTGTLVHYVIQEVDRGTSVVAQEVGINSDDSLEDLQVSGSQGYNSRFWGILGVL